jgi:hypothetical protein
MADSSALPLSERPYNNPGEIEITPEMIKAGARVLRDLCDLDGPMQAPVAEEVFSAMYRAKPKADR